MSRGVETEAERRDRLLKLAELPDADIDTSDIPEARPGAWAGAEIGRFYRPRKDAVTIRLDSDALAWFRQRAEAEGRGYQTAINAALRRHVQSQR